MRVSDRLCGFEEELSLAAWRRGHQLNDVEMAALAARLLEQVRRGPCLGDGGRGAFFSNGGRIYIDSGNHPELATPEVFDPGDAVVFLRALERMIAEPLPALRLTAGLDDLTLLRSNVEYRSGTTCGLHESYLHGVAEARTQLAPQLLPFLASRVVLFGAGGFDPRQPGLELTLSPRAASFTQDVSDASTHSRGLYHTKDEPHCTGHAAWHRLHLTCGDSLLSDRALWLKLATTSLVVRVLEQGERPADSVALRSPVEAFKVFAADPTLRARAPLVRGGGATALELQRHYLAQVEAQLVRRWMPSWAREVVAAWASLLDDLGGAVDPAITGLDWAMKQLLFRQLLVERDGPDVRQLEVWNRVLGAVSDLLRIAGDKEPTLLTVERVLGPGSSVPTVVRDALGDSLAEADLDWDGLGPFLALREEALAADLAYGRLDAWGTGAALQAAGLLPQVASRAEVERALTHPPRRGRARVRGEWILRLAGSGEHRATWDRIVEIRTGRYLDLGDPFVASCEWRSPPPRPAPPAPAGAPVVPQAASPPPGPTAASGVAPRTA